MTNIPPELRFAKSHEWVRLDNEIATIGISDHAQRELTDVVFVELPEMGRTVAAGEPCAVVESVKTASDIYAPIDGRVVEINSALSEDPGLVNREPYGGGWFFKLQLDQPIKLETLLDSEAYRRLVAG